MFAISKGVKIEIIFSIIGSLILWMAKLSFDVVWVDHYMCLYFLLYNLYTYILIGRWGTYDSRFGS